jgi:anti-sigma factor RsiW
MTDPWTDSLSELLDGGLPSDQVRELERHLETCAECRETLAQLRAVKQRAGALVDPPAPDDLWAGIASRIGTAGSTSASRAPIVPLPRRRSFATWLVPVVAAAAALALIAGTPWLLSRTRHETAVVAQPEPAGTAQLATFDATEVEGEIAQLQQALDRGRGKLDPKTVEVLEKNLKLIRTATEDARRALAADPANKELQDYFTATVQSKIRLMKQATLMAGV